MEKLILFSNYNLLVNHLNSDSPFFKNSSFKCVQPFVNDEDNTLDIIRKFGKLYNTYEKNIDANKEIAIRFFFRARNRTVKGRTSLCCPYTEKREELDLLNPTRTNSDGSWIYPAYALAKDVLNGLNSKEGLTECFINVEEGSWIKQIARLGTREKNLKENAPFVNFLTDHKNSFCMMAYEQETPECGYIYDNLTFAGGKTKVREGLKCTALREFAEEVLGLTGSTRQHFIGKNQLHLKKYCGRVPTLDIGRRQTFIFTVPIGKLL